VMERQAGSRCHVRSSGSTLSCLEYKNDGTLSRFHPKSMNICKYIYLNISEYIFMYECTHIHIYPYMHILCVYLYIDMYTYTYRFIHIYIHMCI